MRLADFINVSATQAEMKAAERNSSLRELVEALVKAGEIKEEDVNSIYNSLRRREDLGSTGIGKGVAVPHAKTDKVEKLVGMLGRSARGVEFAALDGEPVHIFFLILSPAKEPGPREHLRALEHISKLVRVDMYTKFLKDSKTKSDLDRLIVEEDDGIEA